MVFVLYELYMYVVWLRSLLLAALHDKKKKFLQKLDIPYQCSISSGVCCICNDEDCAGKNAWFC